MRKCVICEQEKELELFRKQGIYRRHTCKACYSAKYASGKPNEGRFKKGHPSHKGKPRPALRKEPRYIKKGRPITSEVRTGGRAHQWALDVKTRDGFKCKVCGTSEMLTTHHIIPWKDSIEKRFLLDNGITLCRRCHSRTERFIDESNGKINLLGGFIKK